MILREEKNKKNTVFRQWDLLDFIMETRTGLRITRNFRLDSTHFANLLQSCIEKKSHSTGKHLHAQFFRVGLFKDTFLLNRLIEFYAKCRNFNYARQVFDQMPQRNVYSWNAIVGAYCKAGNPDDAYQLFERMPERNVVSWNTVIGLLVRSGSEEKALDLYYQMIRKGFKPTHFTFASVLGALGSLLDLKWGRRCHALVIKVGLELNMYVENALVSMYSKCGSMEDSLRVFDEISEPNEVSFTSMMRGLALTDRVEESLRMFSKMQRNGVRIDDVTLSSILGICTRAAGCKSALGAQAGAFDSSCTRVHDKDGQLAFWVDGEVEDYSQTHEFSGNSQGKQIHSLAIRIGFDSNLHVGNSLIDMYAKCGSIDDAETVFGTMPDINVVSWNVLIAGYGQRGQGEKAIELLHQMQHSGFEPDEVTSASMLSACVKSGDIETAREMFDKMVCPSLSSWNTVIAGYCQGGNHAEALNLFRNMQFSNVRPDRTTVAVILSSCAGIGLLESGKQVHAAATRANLHVDLFVGSGLIDMYSKCGNIKIARLIFDKMTERDVVGWNSLIAGFALNSQNKEAFQLFKKMREEDMNPTRFSYASVIISCARLSSIAQGRQIHTQTIKHGFINDVFVGSALIDMYAKCGGVEEARQFFDSMPVKNIVSWNEMIHGYAQNGCGREAVEVFEQMLRRAEKPDSITFIAVLTACSHSGLVNEGLRFFDSMEKDHGIVPLADHYSCIVDSLGRAGRLEEAEILMKNMPYKDDPIIWEVLLSSCRLHSNVEVGKRAAEKIFFLDPDNPTPYVLLANIYAELGRWDNASGIRRLMIGRGVTKNPAYSWIEVENRVHAFLVDDDLRMVSDEFNVINNGMNPSLEVSQNVS